MAGGAFGRLDGDQGSDRLGEVDLETGVRAGPDWFARHTPAPCPRPPADSAKGAPVSRTSKGPGPEIRCRYEVPLADR
jgi:hypothetical protein